MGLDEHYFKTEFDYLLFSEMPVAFYPFKKEFGLGVTRGGKGRFCNNIAYSFER